MRAVPKHLVLLAFFLPAQALAAPDPDVLKAGEAAPRFAMKTINAEIAKQRIFSLARYVGEKPEEPKAALVLSFAASYCEPCKKELAELKPLEAKLAKAGILLAIVIVDTEPDGMEAMRRLTVDELKLPYPVLSDHFGVLARRYGANKLPYVVVIDKNATVSWIHSGFTEGGLGALTEKLGL